MNEPICQVCRGMIANARELELRCVVAKRTGEAVWKRHHDACHARYMAEKTGLADVTDPAQVARHVRERAAMFSKARKAKGRVFQFGKQTIIAPAGDQRFLASYRKEGARQRSPLPLGAIARAKMLRAN